MQFIERYDAEYVLILSGDHIYSMDYAKMIDYHKKTGAACTIAVIDVPIAEASRFGIMSTKEDGTIFKFTEKPKNPDSTKASMGIYVFTRAKLFDYLIADAGDESSANDFGKNIIPAMLGAGEKMMAYSFEGYWKDVGTIESLWEANMDILGENPVLKLNDSHWRVLSRNENAPPQYIGPHAVIENSSITEGCEILGTVRNSVLGANVRGMEGAVVEDAVLMGDCIIHEGARVSYAMIDREVSIGENAVVGKVRGEAVGITLLGEGVQVPAGGVIADGEIVSRKGGAM